MMERQKFLFAMQATSKAVFPKKALMLQKFYMSHYMRKTRNITVATYKARVARMNEYLKEFPPFATNQEFNDDALKTNMYFNFPRGYVKQLTLQGFEITENTLDDVYDAFERVESCETEEQAAGNKHKSESASRVPRKKHKVLKPDEIRATFCELHGKNKGHNTGECKVLIKKARKMKDSYRTDRFKSGDSRNNSKYSSYPKSKKELNAYAEKYMAKKLKQRQDQHNFEIDNEDHEMDMIEFNHVEEDTLDAENKSFKNNDDESSDSSDDEETGEA